MAATTVFRDTHFAGPHPSQGTLPMAANTLLPKGTMVAMNASGYAVEPTDGDGFPVLGVAKATYDNRTGSEAGGLAGDLDVEIEYGVHALDFVSGDGTPKPGDLVFSVDNQTVSVDSDSSARGIAGIVSEVHGTQAYVWMGPHVTAQVEAIDLAAAEAAIEDLQADALVGTVPVTIGMSPAWSDGSANGFDPTVFAFAFNPEVDDEPFIASVALPDDLDDDEDIIVKIRAAISSVATDDDVTMLLSARINGGSELTPTNATVLAVAAQDIDFTIPAASVPAGAKSLFLSIRASNELDTHDAYLYSVEVQYTRVPATA